LLILTLSGCVEEKNEKETDQPDDEIKTIYVGISDDYKYSSIQDAINTASNNDTIIVENGIYNECIIINNSINLIGKSKDQTIIDYKPAEGESQIPIISINADNCYISNFKIAMSSSNTITKGIYVTSSNNTIYNNHITNVTDGIYLEGYTRNNTITKNQIDNNLIGIESSGSEMNNITNNIIFTNDEYGIFLKSGSDDNNISNNMIYDNAFHGIRIKGSNYNTVYNNCFKDNTIGVYCCCGANYNRIYQNVIINNSEFNGKETSGLLNYWHDSLGNKGNYWGDYTGIDEDLDGIGDSPYLVTGANNQDNKPLMNPPENNPYN